MKGGKYFNYIILTIMKTMDKEQLIKEYIENNNLKSNEMYYDYFDIAKYKIKDSRKPLDDFIKKFLNDYLLINFNFNSYEDLINDIKDFDVLQVAGWEVDDFYNKLMSCYEFFDAWLDINERNEFSIVETIQQAQIDAYYELYDAIKNYVIDFLKRK